MSATPGQEKPEQMRIGRILCADSRSTFSVFGTRLVFRNRFEFRFHYSKMSFTPWQSRT